MAPRRESSIATQFLFPEENVDVLSTSTTYMLLAAVLIFWGQPLIGVALSALAGFVIFNSTARLSKSLERWLIVSTLSTLVCLGTWYFTSVGKEKKRWFVAKAIEKLWAIFLGYSWYDEIYGLSPKTKGPRSSGILERVVELHVKILQGRNLVAKDTNVFGRRTTSDPYVILMLGGKERLGKTDIVFKSLDPTWSQEFSTPTAGAGNPPSNNSNYFKRNIMALTLENHRRIECHIYDHDTMSADDPMGTVYVPIPTLRDFKTVNWYPAEKGEGENHCDNATGELLVEVEVRTKRMM